MISVSLLLYLSIVLLGAIILIWITSLIMIRKQKIFLFLPFFIAGMLFCFNAAFVFYEIFLNLAWSFLEFVTLIILLWILIILRRENGNK